MKSRWIALLVALAIPALGWAASAVGSRCPLPCGDQCPFPCKYCPLSKR